MSPGDRGARDACRTEPPPPLSAHHACLQAAHLAASAAAMPQLSLCNSGGVYRRSIDHITPLRRRVSSQQLVATRHQPPATSHQPVTAVTASTTAAYCPLAHCQLLKGGEGGGKGSGRTGCGDGGVDGSGGGGVCALSPLIDSLCGCYVIAM